MDASPTIKPGKYRNVYKPSIEVEVVTEAQYRMGEVRQKCVIYARDEQFYVRSVAEFLAKFRPLEG
jgi:hypothetical protein